MRIVVNDIAASTGGAMSILKDFYNYIKNDTQNEWIFLLSDNYFEETENIKIITLQHIKKSWIHKIIFDFITGKQFISKLNPDVVFSMQNIITFGIKKPQIVYVHQSLPFQSVKKFSFFKSEERVNAVYQYIIGKFIKLSVQKADKVIVQTKWMKDAVCKKANISKDKIINILPNIEDFSRYKKDGIFDKTSFFYPTSDNIYKNNDCIYKASELLNKKGIINYNVKITLEDKKIIPNIKFISRIPREKVINEYNQSTLVFPSYIETFGLPMAEARQMGTIILASDCAFSREILDGYDNAYYFDPYNPEELAILMSEVINGEIIRKLTHHDYIKEMNSWSCVNNILQTLIKL